MKQINKIDGIAKPIRQVLMKEKYQIDVYQREYKWGEEQISALIDDLTSRFSVSYKEGDERIEVQNYVPYFLGSFVINQKDNVKYIVDGQQRLTSLTLFLIYLRNYANKENIQITNIDDLIYSEQFGKKSFNIEIEDRIKIITAIFEDEDLNKFDNLLQSQKNLIERYNDIEQNFEEYFKNPEVMPLFVDWLIEKIIMVEIIAYNDDDALTIFETMNDRGLSLTSTDLLKSYLLTNIKDIEKRNETNELWKQQITKLLEFDKKEDVYFLKNWLRAKYATDIREGKKDAINKDFDNIDKYHRWIRDEKKKVGINNDKSDDYYLFSNKHFKFFSNIYLKIEEALYNFNPEFSNLFYIDYHNFSFAQILILSTINYEDTEEIINKKIKLVSYFVEMYIIFRKINKRTMGYSAIKYTMFKKLVLEIRNKNIFEIKEVLKNFINEMEEKWEGFDELKLGSQNKSFIKFLLARITQYVEQEVGINSTVKNYMNNNQKKPFEIEHLTPNKYVDFIDEYSEEIEFDNYRNKIGDLVLLPSGINQSHNDDPYEKKVQLYISQNILAGSLNEKYYEKNPTFRKFIEESKLNFHNHEHMRKEDIEERTNLYKKICQRIWNLERFDEIIN